MTTFMGNINLIPSRREPAYRVTRSDGSEYRANEGSAAYAALDYILNPDEYNDPHLSLVTFLWDDRNGLCYDCGRPAAYYLSGLGAPNAAAKRCAVCAAEVAAGGEPIRRLPNYRLPSGVTTEPQYTTEHEEGCWFLGRHSQNAGRGVDYHFDLWWKPEEPTVIARCSNEPGDYRSGLHAVGEDLPLSIAFGLAVKYGLITLADTRIASRLL